MAEWAPVAQVLGGATKLSSGRSSGLRSAGLAGVWGTRVANLTAYADPPDLHWELVPALRVLYLLHFHVGLEHLCILASWMKRVQPNSKAIFYYSVAAALFFLQIIFKPHTAV